ncbi:hypothetical protein HY086_05120 [Candidatus Gottesmanbacteria bacterium]|nr:hypothetical protein [Candidatus Gottesmanbacteria bacterium]
MATSSSTSTSRGNAGLVAVGIGLLVLIGLCLLVALGQGWLTYKGPGASVLPTAAPTAAPSMNIIVVSLKYDETGGIKLTPGQQKLVSQYLRDAMAKGTTQPAMESAVRSIQAEATSAKATVYTGNTLALNQLQAWMLWCPNAKEVDTPTDVSDVFNKLEAGPGKIWIQVPFAEGVPLRTKNTWKGCPEGFWAVAVD